MCDVYCVCWGYARCRDVIALDLTYNHVKNGRHDQDFGFEIDRAEFGFCSSALPGDNLTARRIRAATRCFHLLLAFESDGRSVREMCAKDCAVAVIHFLPGLLYFIHTHASHLALVSPSTHFNIVY